MNMKIIDRRNQAMGGQNDTRKRSQITAIAWHYTAVARKNRAFITSHESFWKNNHGWTYGGYHFYIDADANIYQNYNYETVSNGVGGNNSYLVNICVEANSATDYSQAQIEAREWLTRKVMKDLNIPASRVFGHKELPNQSTSCPGYSKEQMNEFRRKLQGGASPVRVEPVAKPVAKPVVTGNATVKNIQKTVGVTQDGWDGPNTRKGVVKLFQRYFGANADGYVGNETLNKSKVIRYRDKGWHVYAVQAMLYLKGYTVVGNPDQIAGPKFVQAVKNFQKDNGLGVDGTPGKQTYGKLLKL